jgi:hypothetical protein
VGGRAQCREDAVALLWAGVAAALSAVLGAALPSGEAVGLVAVGVSAPSEEARQLEAVDLRGDIFENDRELLYTIPPRTATVSPDLFFNCSLTPAAAFLGCHLERRSEHTKGKIIDSILPTT